MKVTKPFHFFIWYITLKSLKKLNFSYISVCRSIILISAVSSFIFVFNGLQVQLIKYFCFLKFTLTEKVSIGNFSQPVCQLERDLFITANHDTTTMIIFVKSKKGAVSFHWQLTSRKSIVRLSQQTWTCLKSTIDTLEKDLKFVQSQQKDTQKSC